MISMDPKTSLKPSLGSRSANAVTADAGESSMLAAALPARGQFTSRKTSAEIISNPHVSATDRVTEAMVSVAQDPNQDGSESKNSKLKTLLKGGTVQVVNSLLHILTLYLCAVGESIQVGITRRVPAPDLLREKVGYFVQSGGNYIYACLGVCLGSALLSRLLSKSLAKYSPEVMLSLVSGYALLGESVMPSIMPGYSDPRDIPMALAGALLSYIFCVGKGGEALGCGGKKN